MKPRRWRDGGSRVGEASSNDTSWVKDFPKYERMPGRAAPILPLHSPSLVITLIIFGLSVVIIIGSHIRPTPLAYSSGGARICEGV